MVGFKLSKIPIVGLDLKQRRRFHQGLRTIRAGLTQPEWGTDCGVAAIAVCARPVQPNPGEAPTAGVDGKGTGAKGGIGDKCRRGWLVSRGADCRVPDCRVTGGRS